MALPTVALKTELEAQVAIANAINQLASELHSIHNVFEKIDNKLNHIGAKIH